MSPRPPRGDTWKCGICGTDNEPWRTTCIDASKHTAPKPPPKDD